MKTGRFPDGKTVKPSRRSCLKPRSTENSTKKTNRLIHKARGDTSYLDLLNVFFKLLFGFYLVFSSDTGDALCLYHRRNDLD